eukprot:CAMPEP_0113682684 /NCGR_PEP_ID=MMETSP0038_2-20120614/12818_1 /TAXON_ID=2898 /ORGANISM="Cryptomonas paramecium" /LENGTH=269 /DNA_ID=CAMNT_0000601817 /DNA_START=247 /DNA_END=1056 /DNA_ORIENTATION=+ /assembly_acc=CAM_ASM_000170
MSFLILVTCHSNKAEECPVKISAAADELTKAGRILLKNNQESVARACFSKALQQNPKYVPALLELGTLESKSRDYIDAVRHLSDALQQELSTAAFNNLAIVYQDMGAHVEAVRMYRRVLNIDEDDASAYYNLGTALEKISDFKGASKAYRQAIELEPEEAKYYNNLGGSLAGSNRTDVAEKSYKWAIKLDPRFVDAYYNLGNLLLGLGRVEEAIAQLEAAIKLKPDHSKANVKLADARKALEKKVEAFKAEVDAAIDKAQKMIDRGELR